MTSDKIDYSKAEETIKKMGKYGYNENVGTKKIQSRRPV